MVNDGYVLEKKHPVLDLYIYNYSAQTQYQRLWNEVTLLSRGLILDGKGNIVARPFAKFFNREEHHIEDIPNLPFEVFKKMDGSLGIIYYYQGKWLVATRGAFGSEQALLAQQMLYTTYDKSLPLLEKGNTYLVEIIYPANKIVVDYNNRKELILLAIIDNDTGEDVPLYDIGLPIVERFNGIADLDQLKALNTPNEEGFVIRYSNGFRMKIKFEEYIRLHKILTQISSISIWECLKSGQDFSLLLAEVPDEAYHWVRTVEEELKKQYQLIETKARADMKVLATRKETALYFLSCEYPNVMFKMLENKDYSPAIWRKIRPVYKRLGE